MGKKNKKLCKDCEHAHFEQPRYELPNGEIQIMPLDWYCHEEGIYDKVTGYVISCKEARTQPPCIEMGLHYIEKKSE